jgi:hypothetical protein
MLKYVPIGTEATLCSSHDDQEAKALLLGAHHLSHIRLAIGVRHSKQRSNMLDCTMGSGDRPVRC